MFSQKELAKQRQAAQIRAFKLGQKHTLHVAAISKIPGILYAHNTLSYSKKEVSLPKAGALHFIINGTKSEGFVWHAPQQALEQALHYGLIPVEAPTAKAIATLAIYKHQVLTRAYEKGIISNKHAQKEALVTMAQDNMTALQGLERLVNTFNANACFSDERARINSVINETITSLNRLKLKTKEDLSSLTIYDKDAVTKIDHFYDSEINALHHLQTQLDTADANQIQGMLRATGIDSILIQVKTMSISTLVKIQELNQNISYSRSAASLMRGDLNSAIEDALRVLREYEVDHHNPILPEHQGHYAPAPGTETMAIDFTHLAHNEKKSNNTLRAIIEISGGGISSADKDNGYTLQKQALKTTRFTKWTTNAKPGFYIKRMSAGLLNVLSGLVIGLAWDLPIGFFTSLLSLGRYKMPSLASKIVIAVNSGGPKQTQASELVHRLNFENYSAGVLLGHKLGSLLGETVLDIAKGVWQSARNFRFKGFDELISDFKTGAWENSDKQDYKLDVAISKLKTLTYTKASFERRIAEIENTVISKHRIIPSLTEPLLSSSAQMALPRYHLSSGEWDDISNAGTDGLIAVFETFIHNIHTKHPFTGLIFSGTYALGGLTILAPGLVSFLSKYIELSQIIGKLMAQGTNSAAIASGFTQAKVLAAVFEAIIHGGDSWLAIGAKQFEKNPANTIVYGALAVGLGYGLANYAHVPGLSEYIQDDTGDLPEVGWAFAGGKIGLLLVELLDPKKETGKSDRDSLITELDDELTKILPSATKDKIVLLRKELLDFTSTSRDIDVTLCDVKTQKVISEQYKLEINRLKFIHLLQNNQELLPELDNKTKRDLMFIARNLFKGLDDRSARLRSIKETLYPQLDKSIFTRTITLIADYIPLLARCFISPVSASLQPWRDLGDKLMKDTTRITHAVSKLINYTIKTFVRIFFRGVADVITNEIPARLEGLIRNDSHSISAQTYAATNCYEKSAEAIRQLASVGVDAMRSAATAPTVAAVFSQTQQQTITKLGAQGFFRSPRKIEAGEPSAPLSTRTLLA